MNVLELSEQEIVRRQSLQELRNMGIDPYPAAEFPTNAFSEDIKKEFKDEDEKREVVIAGRMMGRRVMGKASFVELQDSKGRIQVFLKFTVRPLLSVRRPSSNTCKRMLNTSG
jgi:lysyl-tRNA synthetase, class II